MAMTWGGPSGSGFGVFYVGINVDVSSSGWISGYYEVRTNANSVSDSQTLTRTGALGGAFTFSMTTPSPGSQRVGAADFGFQGTPGQSYTLGGVLSGVYSGATPSHSVTVTVPSSGGGGGGPRHPYAPSRWPDLEVLSATAVRVTSMWPNNDGGSGVYAFRFQASKVESFASVAADTGTITSNVADVAGLDQGSLYYFRTCAINAFGNGDWSYPSSATTQLAPPWRPSSLIVTRNSDTQHSLTWAVNYPSGEGNTVGPVWAIAIDRYDNVSQAWSRVATLSGTPSAWTDSSTIANRRYQYRIASWNAHHQSEWWTVGTTSTTPAAPASASAAREGSGIRVSWVGRSPQAQSFVIERATNGVWAGSPVATVAVPTDSWLDASPVLGASHMYRVRAVSFAEPSALSSGYAVTGVIVAIVAPNAPTITGPAGPQDPAGTIMLSWQHNSPDTSPQSAKGLRWRYQGATAWNTFGKTADTAQEWGIAAGTWLSNRVVEFQVQTWGVHASASLWSATGTVVTSTPPTATINSPGSSWGSPVLTIGWGYYDADGHSQAAYRAALVDPVTGTVIEHSGTVAGSASSHTFAGTVRNETGYRVDVTVQDSTGMWSSAAMQSFAVDYPEPPVPDLVAAWQPDQGVVVLSVTNPPGGTPVAIRNDIFRAIGNGAFELIATGLPPNSVFTDTECAAAGVNRYYAQAWSALPSVSESAIVEVEPETGAGSGASVWVSGGPGFTTICRALYGVKISRTSGRAEKVINRYAGRELGTESSGIGRERVLSVSCYVSPPAGRLAPVESDSIEWDELSLMEGPHLYRDAFGRRFWASMSQVSVDENPNGSCTVSFTVTEVGRW